MKRCISLLLIFILLTPTVTFAEDYELTVIINGTLEKLDIPEYYTEFVSRIQQDNRRKLYELSWRGETEDKSKGGYASATVDAQGRIIYYSNYEYGEFEGDYKLSALDLNGAVNIARESMAKILPEFSASLRPAVSENYTLRNSQSYNIRFDRYENGVPFYNNYVLTSVDANTHKLTELKVVWSDVERFPLPKGVVSPQRAQELLLKKIGVSLSYYNDLNNNPILMYGLDNAENLWINAYTGEVVRAIGDSSLSIYEGSNPPLKYESDTYTLRDDTEGLVPYSIMESSVKEMIGIPATFKLSALTISDGQNGTVYYNATYLSDIGESVNVQVDANTNQVTAYYNNSPKEGYVISEEAAIRKATRFVEKSAPLLYEECEQTPYVVYTSNSYNIFFTRIVNGIKYKNNGLLVIINRFTGEITSYRNMWVNKDFSSQYVFISKNRAVNEIFDNIPFELQYVPTYEGKVFTSSSYSEVSLVYAFSPEKPPYVNAVTGRLSNVIGGWHKPNKTKFTDVTGYIYEKEINALLQCNVVDEATYFSPEEPLSQAEYFKWMYRSVNYDSQIDLDQIYNEMYNNGVIVHGERNDEKTIVFEEGVMLLIKFLGYGEVAKLSDTYKTKFLDEREISLGLVGYAAIAQGLGIITENVLSPKETISRGEGASIIYNLLTSGNK